MASLKDYLFRHLGKRLKRATEMASPKEKFCCSGPFQLKVVNWACENHQRCVTASLVEGVYILERDRQQNRQGSDALAPPWWEFFHFQLVYLFTDENDSSIIGAIFEFQPPAPSSLNHSTQNAPRYIIAFRGTLITRRTVLQDFITNLRVIFNELHKSSRFKKAMPGVQDVAAVELSNVWLTGHSLGSAMAMLVGKNMAKMGIFLNAFLFNPPFIYPPIEEIENEKVRHAFHIAANFARGGIAIVLKDRQERAESEAQFVALSKWVPFLFVNNEDHICREYIGYFESREKMEQIGAGAIGRLATQNSLGGLLSSAVGKESEPLHLLPSANLTVNRSPTPDFRQAHEIGQWWRPDLQLQSNLYRY